MNHESFKFKENRKFIIKNQVFIFILTIYFFLFNHFLYFKVNIFLKSFLLDFSDNFKDET